ncbi:MAG: hypothetical protein ACM3SR_11090 [Ignavibacteriales bacterium]|jgi:hypothetical protein
MIQIVCFIDPEDYWNLDSMKEQNIRVNSYGYTFEVVGLGEAAGGSSVVRVIELLNAYVAVGLALPNNISLDGEFQLSFICQDNPSRDIPLVCKLSEEVKRTVYKGDDLERLEYVGFSLEKFYESKGVTFYLYDLRGSGQSR